MRILFVSNLYPPNVLGGYERLCFDVASAFAGKGHAVSVLTSTFGEERRDFPGQIIHRRLELLIGPTIYEPFAGDAQTRERINRSNITTLRDTITAERPDLIFSWNLFFLDRSVLEALTGAGAAGRSDADRQLAGQHVQARIRGGFFPRPRVRNREVPA